MVLTRLCKRESCGQPFTPTMRNKAYCPACTALAARPRLCQRAGCGLVYTVKSPAALDSKYCSIPCSLTANRQNACDAAAKARRARGRVEVECALVKSGRCLHPDDLITVVRSRSGAPTHHKPDCQAIGRETGYGRKKKGATRACEKCGQDLGYRFPSDATKYCRDCGCGTCKGRSLPRGRGEWHTCASVKCDNRIYVAPWRAKLSAAGLFYCEDHDGRRARRTATRVRCTKCKSIGRYHKGKVPTSIDPATLTWICLACRSYKTAVRSFLCMECGDLFERRVKTSAPDTGVHLCRKTSCRSAYREKIRAQSPPCAYCGEVIQRRGRHRKYCDWTCCRAAKKGRPVFHYRPSKAEQRIMAAWKGGARGVRPLARVSRTSPATVQKFIRAGKIAS